MHRFDFEDRRDLHMFSGRKKLKSLKRMMTKTRPLRRQARLRCHAEADTQRSR